MAYIKGSQLRVGEVIDIWWAPNRARILELRPYKGRLEHLFPEGAQVAMLSHPRLNPIGMTIDNSDYYETFTSERPMSFVERALA